MRTIVCIGGGTGLSHIAPAIASQSDLQVAFICPTSDDGGSTGKIRDDRGLGPVGDLLDVLCAVARNNTLAELLRHRFGPDNMILGDRVGELLQGHTAGNIMLAALQECMDGSLARMCHAAAGPNLLDVPSYVRVLPCTDAATWLEYRRGEGEKWEGGERLLDELPRRPPPPIEAIRLSALNGSSEPYLLGAAFDAIDNAQLVVLGPGDFVGSVLASVMVPGFVEALRRSQRRQAKVVLAVNLVTKATDSYDFTVRTFVIAFARLTGVRIDIVVCSSAPLPSSIANRYQEEHARGVRVDIEDGWEGKRVVVGEFLEIDEHQRARHKLATFIPVLMSLLP
jgi:uncharacterized cofD-like protein